MKKFCTWVVKNYKWIGLCLVALLIPVFVSYALEIKLVSQYEENIYFTRSYIFHCIGLAVPCVLFILTSFVKSRKLSYISLSAFLPISTYLMWDTFRGFSPLYDDLYAAIPLFLAALISLIFFLCLTSDWYSAISQIELKIAQQKPPVKPSEKHKLEVMEYKVRILELEKEIEQLRQSRT